MHDTKYQQIEILMGGEQFQICSKKNVAIYIRICDVSRPVYIIVFNYARH